MSGKLSTKDVKTGGSFIPKNIEPGNVKARMLEIELDQPEFLKKDDAYFIVLHLETEKPSEDFVGFHTQFDDDTSPTYEGQTAKVKSNRWSYKDATTKSGIEIKRDEEILKFIKNLCEAFGCEDWWNATDMKYETVEDLVADFNKEKPFKDVWLNWCIGGRQYTKQNGYKAWDLHLPKFSKDGIPFESLNVTLSKLITFNAADHTEITEPKPVDDFGTEDEADGDLPPMADSPEFEL